DETPVLVKTQVADDIRHAKPGGARTHRGTGGKETKAACGCVEDAGWIMSQLGRHRAGEAVPELGGVGQNLHTVIVGVTRGLGVEVAHQLGGAENVEERLRLAEGEAGKLNESSLGDKSCRIGIVEHRANAEISTDRSVFRLVARIRGKHRAAGKLEVVRLAGVLSISEALSTKSGGTIKAVVAAAERQALRGAPLGLRPHIAADPEAHVGAGDVIEPDTIHAADLHILDWLGLDREIGSLRARQRKETTRAADQKTFDSHCQPHFTVNRATGPGTVVR